MRLFTHASKGNLESQTDALATWTFGYCAEIGGGGGGCAGGSCGGSPSGSDVCELTDPLGHVYSTDPLGKVHALRIRRPRTA